MKSPAVCVLSSHLQFTSELSQVRMSVNVVCVRVCAGRWHWIVCEIQGEGFSRSTLVPALEATLRRVSRVLDLE